MKDIYTIEEIREKIDSGYYNAEMMLEHAMRQIENLEEEVEGLKERTENLHYLLYGDDI